MVDIAVLIREYLLTQASVTDFLGTANPNGSIYTGDLHEKFNPQLGPGIQLMRSGGIPAAEIPALDVSESC